MTHELRTPLNAIIGFSEILGEDKTLNTKQRETLDIINNSGEHLLDVINEILDLSKIEAGKMEKNVEVFSFVPMLKSVYEMLSMKANAKRIAFNFSAGSAMPGESMTDRSKLRQILINLIGNAIKFTDKGSVCLCLKVAADGAAIEIEDTGTGISPEEQKRLFERFRQGKNKRSGSGLGLYLSRCIIESHQGTIGVSSELGKGSLFTIKLPIYDAA